MTTNIVYCSNIQILIRLHSIPHDQEFSEKLNDYDK